MGKEQYEELDPEETSPRDAIKLLMGDTPLVELTLRLHEARRALSIKEVREILSEYPEDDVKWAVENMTNLNMLRSVNGSKVALHYNIVTKELLGLQYEVMEKTREARGMERLEDAVRREIAWD